MRGLILLTIFFGCTQFLKADYVDIATLKVNRVLVRKMTNNTETPYLVSLSKFKVGDTLSMKVWTDHGGEHNSAVLIKNLETNVIDTFDWENKYIITKELLEKEYLISVIFRYFNSNEGQATWNVCKLIPNNQVESIYSCVNILRDFLISNVSDKVKFASTLFKDSIIINFTTDELKSNEIRRQIVESFYILPTVFSSHFKLGKSEIDFISEIDAVNYVHSHNYSSQFYCKIHIDDANLNAFWFLFGNSEYQLKFYFSYSNNSYNIVKLLLL